MSDCYHSDREHMHNEAQRCITLSRRVDELIAENRRLEERAEKAEAELAELKDWHITEAEYNTLKSENSLLQDFIREVCTALGLVEPFDNEAATMAVDKLKAEIQRKDEALRFYAQEANWYGPSGVMSKDRGERANSALGGGE